MFGLLKKTAVNMLFTSRFINEITTVFQKNIQLEIRATDEDVNMYLNDRLSDVEKIVGDKHDLKKKIRETILSRTQGMYVVMIAENLW